MSYRYSPMVLSAMLILLGNEIICTRKVFAGTQKSVIRVKKELSINYQESRDFKNKEQPKLVNPTPQMRWDFLPSEPIDLKNNIPENFSPPTPQPSQDNVLEYDRKSRESNSQLQQVIDVEKFSPQLPQADYSQQMRNIQPVVPQYNAPRLDIPSIAPAYETEKPKIPNFYPRP